MRNSNKIKNEDVKILIAEDDFLVSEMIEGELATEGYRVVGKAADGLQAVELTQSLKPDIVLMDIRMPSLNGLEASKQIMNACPTPIIILTAYENRDMISDAGDAGVGAYLNKPLDARELEKAILISMARFKDIVDLREKNNRLEEADKLNKTLMKEIHHRVKNNFQLTSSLLNLQVENVEDIKTKKVLEAGRDRIQTLAILHEKLYEADNFVSLPMKDFIEDLMFALVEAYNIEDNITLDINIGNIILDSNKAVSIGLLLNETVTNSIKYAFPNPLGKRNLIKVSMIVEDKDILLRISDNGIGISDIEEIKSGDTLGVQLLYLLTESQLGGNLEVRDTKGMEYLIRFKP